MQKQIIHALLGVIYEKTGVLWGVRVAHIAVMYDDNMVPIKDPPAAGKAWTVSNMPEFGFIAAAKCVDTEDIQLNAVKMLKAKTKETMVKYAFELCTEEQKQILDALEVHLSRADSAYKVQGTDYVIFIRDSDTGTVTVAPELRTWAYPEFYPVMAVLESKENICTTDRDAGDLKVYPDNIFAILYTGEVVCLTAQVSPLLYAMYARMASDAQWARRGSPIYKTVRQIFTGTTLTHNWHILDTQSQKIEKHFMTAQTHTVDCGRAAAQTMISGGVAPGAIINKMGWREMQVADALTSRALCIAKPGAYVTGTQMAAVSIESEALRGNTQVELSEATRYLFLNMSTELHKVSNLLYTNAVEFDCNAVPRLVWRKPLHLYMLSLWLCTMAPAMLTALLQAIDPEKATFVRVMLTRPADMQEDIVLNTKAKRVELHLGLQPTMKMTLPAAEQFTYGMVVTKPRFALTLVKWDVKARYTSYINRYKNSIALFLPYENKKNAQLMLDLQGMDRGILILSFVDEVSHLTQLNKSNGYALQYSQAMNKAVTQYKVLASAEVMKAVVNNVLLPNEAHAVVMLKGSAYIELCSGLNMVVRSSQKIKRLCMKVPVYAVGNTYVHIYASVDTLCFVGATDDTLTTDYFIYGDVSHMQAAHSGYPSGQEIRVHVKPSQLAKYMAILQEEVKEGTLNVNNGESSFSADISNIANTSTTLNDGVCRPIAVVPYTFAGNVALIANTQFTNPFYRASQPITSAAARVRLIPDIPEK